MDKYTAQRNLRYQLDAVYTAILTESIPIPPKDIHPSRWKAMINSAKEDWENLKNKVYQFSQIERY